MFQPCNESFVRATVEATLERHANETEEERALRQARLAGGAFRLGSLLAGLSRWLTGASVRSQAQDPSEATPPRGVRPIKRAM